MGLVSESYKLIAIALRFFLPVDLVASIRLCIKNLETLLHANFALRINAHALRIADVIADDHT